MDRYLNFCLQMSLTKFFMGLCKRSFYECVKIDPDSFCFCMIFSAARVDDAKRAVGGFAARAKEYLLDTHEDADVEAQAPLDKEQEALQAVQVGDLAKLKSLIEDAEAEGVRIDLDALIKASFAQPHKKFGQRHLQAKIQVPIHSYLSERKADQDRRTADSQLGKQ
jgi:hypothetical protein